MASQEEDKQSSPTITERNPSEEQPKETEDQDRQTSVKASTEKVEDQERPPSRHLWVGNVATNVTKEELSEQFSRFGDLENVADYPSRNYAFVNFKSMDDAIYAKKGLQGTVLGGMALRIEFARGGIRSEGHHWGDEAEAPQDQGHTEAGSAKAFERSKRDRDEPSETLWVGFPLCMKMDERKLDKAFSPFGGIKRITTFPGRTYAFVEFHSVKAAARAKNVLQGKLFNDPRVSISFSKSEVGPVEHHGRSSGPILSPPQPIRELPSALLPKPGGFVNPRNDRYLNLDSSRTHSPNPRRHLEGGVNEANMFFPGTRYDSGFRDSMDRDTRQERNYIRNAEMDMWPSRALPGGGFIQPRHAPPHMDERWNIHDEGSGRRDPKRPRPGANLNHAIRGPMDGYLPKMDILNNNQMESWGDQEGSNRFLQGRRQPLPGYNMDLSRSDWVHHAQPVDHGVKESFQWQGIIAKSGTIVCHARCYAIGSAGNVALPESVNCTARTSLEMLAKHINEVGEFSLVSFVPLGEHDVEPYQDFIAYLSEKNRAAVCKLSQECTLFLVPPSEFVEQFLKASRSNGIIGVMLKLQQPFSSSAAEQASIQPPMKAERLISTNIVPEVTYQNPNHGALEARTHEVTYQNSSHRAPEVRLPAFNPSDGVASHALLPQHVPSSNSSYSPIIGPPSGGGSFNDNALVSFQNPGLAADESWAPNLPPGYGPPQQSTSLRGGFSLAPTTAELALPELGMQQLPSNPTISNPPGYPSSSQNYNHQVKDIGQNLTTAPSYPRQPPPLPQYPHPSTQQQKPPQVIPTIQSDQLSQLLSLTAQQTQQTQHLHENLQPLVNTQPQQLLGASLSNFSSVMSTSSQPPSQYSRNNMGGGADDEEQRELLELAQRKLSEANAGGSAEDGKRFQATLELAAALLQQLQQRPKP